MGRRLTPQAAHAITETRLADDARRRQDARITKLREGRARAHEASAWTEQVEELYLAAIEAKNTSVIERNLCRPKDIFASGLVVTAVRSMPKVLAAAEKQFRDCTTKRDKAKRKLIGAVRRWTSKIASFDSDLPPHVSRMNAEALHLIEQGLSWSWLAELETMSLTDFLPDDESEFFCTDHVLNIGPQVAEVDDALELYRQARAQRRTAKQGLVSLQGRVRVVTGEVDLAEFGPPYEVSWESSRLKTPWGAMPLFSAAGLGWISGEPGQQLFAHIDQQVASAAAALANSVEISVCYSNMSKHYLKVSDRDVIFAPEPDDLACLLRLQGWTVELVDGDSKSYRLVISW